MLAANLRGIIPGAIVACRPVGVLKMATATLAASSRGRLESWAAHAMC